MSIATLLARPVASPARDRQRTAIIDIGSNSIRLVVYEGPARLPATLFNEKVLAGLGRSLAATGAIDEAALALARTALARFATIAREMEVGTLRTVATAAVRDASNGDVLLDEAAALGLKVELLSGEQEAIAAGEGVLSAIPDADGIVGDLGGGSLELVRIAGESATDRISFPLGVLRLPRLRAKGPHALDRHVGRALKEAGWLGRGKGLPLYMVGGSWRALARLDMHRTGYPLPIIHQYAMTPERIAQLGRAVARSDKAALKAVPGLSSGRVATLGDAAALLGVLLRHLGSRITIASAFGLREGLLFGALDGETRSLDPLLVAAREEGRILGRFPEHGDVLDRWIAPLFAGEPPARERIRHAACLLADVGWHANPEFRAERGVEVALHGNWVAIEAHERAMLAQALFISFGGTVARPAALAALASDTQLAQATRWGLAMRLGQRLSAGLAAPLQRTRLSLEPDALVLDLGSADRQLFGDTVQRRLTTLAAAFDRAGVVRL